MEAKQGSFLVVNGRSWLNTQCIEQEIYGEADFRHDPYVSPPLTVTEKTKTAYAKGTRSLPKILQ